MTAGKRLRSRTTRRLLLLLVWGVVLGLLWMRRPVLSASGFPSVGGQDLLAHWSAARLLLKGDNPYDPVALLAVQRGVAWPGAEAQIFWNPPWLVPLLFPLALLPFQLATVTWLLFQLALLMGCGVLLWHYFAPDAGRLWVGAALAVAFAPSVFNLRLGQMGGLLLLGVVAFLYGERARRDLLAGCTLALLMIKPHIAYLFLLAALWWAWRSRRWRLLAAWLAALIAASVAALLFVPNLLIHYWPVLVAPPRDWATPTLGGWLRLLFGLEGRWLQYLLPAVGVLALMIWLRRRSGPWRWQEVTSPLLLASVLTAPYGWSFDHVVLLPVVVDLVARLRWASPGRRVAVLSALVASQVGLWVLNRVAANEIFYIWHAPALAAIYFWGHQGVAKHGDQDATEDNSTPASGGEPVAGGGVM